ncbi:hypothetical protein U1707_00120 [Sphingomonas sp. PB2P12]|uniref:hypothetical protein n=1 Tax=Sphingomonas sandaracina TaxID=3096157 RepID=UPI002FC7BF9D
MKKSAKTTDQSDVELIAMLVARQLQLDHAIDASPTLNDYSVITKERAYGPDTELHVGVDLGRGVRAEVVESLGHDGNRDFNVLLQSAKDISETTADLLTEASSIRAMLSEVKSATKREIAKANRRNLPYALTSAELLPVQTSSRDNYCVRVEHTAFGSSLRLEQFAFTAHCAEDAIRAFAEVREQQEGRAAGRAELDRIGASGKIDAVVSGALDQAGFNFAEILAKFRDQDVVDLKAADGRNFCLYLKEGSIFSNLTLADGVHWNEDKITFDKAPEAFESFSTGNPLRDLYDHPLFGIGLVAHSIYGAAGGYGSVSCNASRLAFDADSGRRWSV